MSVSRRFAGSMAVVLAMAMVAAAPLAAAVAQKPPVRVGGEVKEPKKIKNVAPVYPEEAKSAEVQGVVILEILVGTDGSVIKAKVLRSVALLDMAAIEAVEQWKYEPTVLDGEPVELLMVVTVNFTLK